MTRSISDLRELDAVLSGSLSVITGKLTELLCLLEDKTATPLRRFELLREIAEEARAFRLGGEDKIRVATGTCETVSPSTAYTPVTFVKSLTLGSPPVMVLHDHIKSRVGYSAAATAHTQHHAARLAGKSADDAAARFNGRNNPAANLAARIPCTLSRSSFSFWLSLSQTRLPPCFSCLRESHKWDILGARLGHGLRVWLDHEQLWHIPLTRRRRDVRSRKPVCQLCHHAGL